MYNSCTGSESTCFRIRYKFTEYRGRARSFGTILGEPGTLNLFGQGLYASIFRYTILQNIIFSFVAHSADPEFGSSRHAFRWPLGRRSSFWIQQPTKNNNNFSLVNMDVYMSIGTQVNSSVVWIVTYLSLQERSTKSCYLSRFYSHLRTYGILTTFSRGEGLKLSWG